MDQLAAMRVFQKVAATLSFTQTGERLGLAPSSISRHIDLLEQQLGVKLLSRSTRKLTLTEAGRLYQRELELLLGELDGLHEQIAGYGAAPRGRLRISSPRMFGKRLLMPHLGGFMHRYPELQVELSIADEYVDLIASDTDLAIRVGTLGNSTLISRSLGAYRRVLCAHPNYLAARGTPERPEQLAEHACLLYRQAGERVAWEFSPVGRAVPVFPTASFYSNDTEVLWQAAQQGLGIAQLPYWLVKQELEQGSLCQVLPDWPMRANLERHAIHLVYPFNRKQSAKVQAFIDYFWPIINECLA